jgi:lipopolysaccharide transport system ATP-binding protein
MSQPKTVIEIHNLSKQYQIGAKLESYRTLREEIAKAAKESFCRLRRIWRGEPAVGRTETFWALNNLSLEIKRGEIVGVIGRNGSGKSTLLKILSRVTEPTKGWAKVYGRVGSLLEVGTGFHPELTGRENIYLYGSILGMKRAEIAAKFDQIVAFSAVEAFLDTPVKHFSSGMYVRLAFAVAAHIEPEILIVDEVLAVGDAAFQRKCLAKMDEVAKEGRTVLFVSHNMGLIQALCQRVIIMRNGSVYVDDNTMKAIGIYMQTMEENTAGNLLERTDRNGKGEVRLTRIDISTSGDSAVAALITGHPARFVFNVSKILPGMSCSFAVYNQYGQPVTYFNSEVHAMDNALDSKLETSFSCEIDELMLMPGRYYIDAAIRQNGELQDHLKSACYFVVEHGELRGQPVPGHSAYGSVFIPHRWVNPIN